MVIRSSAIVISHSQRFIGDDVYFSDGTETVLYSGKGEKLAWDDEFGANGYKDKRTDLSAVIGVALSKVIGKRTLVLDLRSSHDFTSWRRYENQSGRKEVLHRNLMVSVGMEF